MKLLLWILYIKLLADKITLSWAEDKKLSIIAMINKNTSKMQEIQKVNKKTNKMKTVIWPSIFID